MRQWAAAAVVVWLGSAPAGAVGLCNCCAGQAGEATCAAACAAVTVPEGQCTAVLDHGGSSEISPGVNPLYAMSLRNMVVGDSTRGQLERFRQFLEDARKGAEADRRAALRALAQGEIDAAEADRRARRYGDAMVNYYIAQQAYRAALRR